MCRVIEPYDCFDGKIRHVEVRSYRYLNNIVEQEHRAINP
jgi:hypothetical protein